MNKNSLYISLPLLAVLALASFVLVAKSKDKTIPLTQPTTSQYNNQMPITSGENPTNDSSVPGLPVEPAAAMARKDLALKLSVNEKNILILLIEEKRWSDGCLGLGELNESCMQMIVDGFRIEMKVNNRVYVYRSDKNGDVVRMEKAVTLDTTIHSVQ